MSPRTCLRSPILSEIGLNSMCQLCANEGSSDLNESQLDSKGFFLPSQTSASTQTPEDSIKFVILSWKSSNILT